jgi:hypothetical protein
MDQAQVLDPSAIPAIHYFYVWASSLSMVIAGIAFVFIIEKIVDKTKFALTIIFSALTVIGMFFPHNESIGFISAFIMTPLMLLMIIFIAMIPKWTSDDIKPFILVLFSGVMIYLMGNFLTHHPVKRLGLFPIELARFIRIAAAAVLLVAPLISSETLSRKVKRLKLLALIILSILTVFSIVLIVLNVDIMTTAQVILSTALLYCALYVLVKDNG